MKDHRKMGLNVLSDALLAVVECHIEHPVAADIERHKPMSRNVGRGRREAVSTWRDNAQSSQSPRTIGMEEHRTLDRISREHLILTLARARGMGRDGERDRLGYFPRRHHLDESTLLHPIGRNPPGREGELLRRRWCAIEDDADRRITRLAPRRLQAELLGTGLQGGRDRHGRVGINELEETVEELDRNRRRPLTVMAVDRRSDAEPRLLQRCAFRRAGCDHDPGVAERERRRHGRICGRGLHALRKS